MPTAIVITPVKDSLNTTLQTISAVSLASGDFEYVVFNDFSTHENTEILNAQKAVKKFELINLSDITSNPSPNYKLVLILAQKRAIKYGCPLIIIESDVVIKPNTIESLLSLYKAKPDTGLLGAITVDKNGQYNFPYTFEKTKNNDLINTSHSLSFCCTLLSENLLKAFDFNKLSPQKDWFDVHISRQSKKLGFSNYLAKELEVLHLPHSSRPWKQLKYSNPVLYYFKKLLNNRDRI